MEYTLHFSRINKAMKDKTFNAFYVYVSEKFAHLTVELTGKGSVAEKNNEFSEIKTSNTPHVLNYFALGDNRVLLAKPAEGYKFAGWYLVDEEGNLSEEPVSTETEYEFSQNGADVHIKALFVEEVETLDVTCEGFEYGFFHYNLSTKKQADLTGLTVKTDKGSYDFVTATAIDASNVYAPITIPMNLAKVRQPAPTVTHVFYDDFSKAAGTGSGIEKLYASPTDYAYYYTDPYTNTGNLYGFNEAIRMGKGGASATITTPALKLIEGTKNLKVTFYANGWKADQALNVTASTGTVVGGSDLVMPAATATGSGVMDKSEAALFTVYVENADATTALTFALASTTVDERFILDDLTVDVHDGPIALTPVILADDITGVAAAGVTDATFTYEVRNDNNYTASVECDGTVVTAASVENATKTITYSVSENTDTANDRSGWITITLNDPESISLKVIVSQNKKIVAGTGKYVPVEANQEDWSGKYIIGYKASSGVRILTGANSGNYANMSDAGDFNQYMDGDNIVSNVDTDIYACTFEKTVNGYSIHCADGYIGYTSTATSKNNNLWFSPNIVEKQYEWTISYSKYVEIQNVYNTKRIIWANASANRFAGYTSKQQEVILYKYME